MMAEFARGHGEQRADRRGAGEVLPVLRRRDQMANRLREAGGDVVGGSFGRGHRDYHADGQRGDQCGRG